MLNQEPSVPSRYDSIRAALADGFAVAQQSELNAQVDSGLSVYHQHFPAGLVTEDLRVVSCIVEVNREGGGKMSALFANQTIGEVISRIATDTNPQRASEIAATIGYLLGKEHTERAARETFVEAVTKSFEQQFGERSGFMERIRSIINQVRESHQGDLNG